MHPNGSEQVRTGPSKPENLEKHAKLDKFTNNSREFREKVRERLYHNENRNEPGKATQKGWRFASPRRFPYFNFFFHFDLRSFNDKQFRRAGSPYEKFSGHIDLLKTTCRIQRCRAVCSRTSFESLHFDLPPINKKTFSLFCGDMFRKTHGLRTGLVRHLFRNATERHFKIVFFKSVGSHARTEIHLNTLQAQNNKH